MGNRATFVIEQEKDQAPIFIYGHQAGYDMMDTFAKAIAHAKVRIDMDDPVYAARMIFSYLTRDYVMGELGWGLSTYFCDSEHSVPVVNLKDKTVRLIPHRWDQKFDIHADPKFVMSVDNFIAKFIKVAVPV
jgi:hypothetical protein